METRTSREHWHIVSALRKRRDSNSGSGCKPLRRFRGARLQPLGHTSAKPASTMCRLSLVHLISITQPPRMSIGMAVFTVSTYDLKRTGRYSLRMPKADEHLHAPERKLDEGPEQCYEDEPLHRVDEFAAYHVSCVLDHPL